MQLPGEPQQVQLEPVQLELEQQQLELEEQQLAPEQQQPEQAPTLQPRPEPQRVQTLRSARVLRQQVLMLR
jgi:hypothetical protein